MTTTSRTRFLINLEIAEFDCGSHRAADFDGSIISQEALADRYEMFFEDPDAGAMVVPFEDGSLVWFKRSGTIGRTVLSDAAHQKIMRRIEQRELEEQAI